jgi:iron complex outermembrane recepter protein
MGFPGGQAMAAGCKLALLLSLVSFLSDQCCSEETLAPKAPSQLARLSLEELLNVEISSVSKKLEPASQAPAAVFVITSDDIRRSGATVIPEVLRLAPGLSVARLNAHDWAISSRGFNDVFANKLLVLMDGRSVYTPLFSGVFWDEQDTLLEDIDRIEVVRGPGATLWGANAVNGVINIITKHAKDTQGGLLSVGGGTEEQGFASVRYGGKIGKDIHIRGYGKFFNRDESVTADGREAGDERRGGRGGFRMDWDMSKQDLFTLQGDLYAETQSVKTTLPILTAPFSRVDDDTIRLNGGNFLSRWTHDFSDASNLDIQFYFDRTSRDTGIFTDERNTWDLDTQYRIKLNRHNELICGFGYRIIKDDTDGSVTSSLRHPERTTSLFSAFVQDEINLIDKKLSLMLGSKFEHNAYTGVEVQPNARLLWTPSHKHTLWASVSRAVRTPSRAEDDIRINQQAFPPGAAAPGPLPALVTLFGNKDFESESVLAYELGYRVKPHPKLSLDLALFFNDYDNLRSLEQRPPLLEGSPLPAHLLIPFAGDNKLFGETYGGELVATLQAKKWWRFQASYSNLQMQLHRERNSTDISSEQTEGDSPQHQFGLRSSIDLPHNIELDTMIRYVDRLPNRNINRYITSDVRVGWHPNKRLELSIVGQNLFDDRHPEFAPSFIRTGTSEVQRSAYIKFTFRF